jgi:glutathione reductase (NADPH)
LVRRPSPAISAATSSITPRDGTCLDFFAGTGTTGEACHREGFRARHRPDYRGVPSVAFTLPPIAAVGLSEAAAREQTPKLRVKSAKVPDWYTARRVGEAVYGYKTLVEAESGRILGAHLVGPHADEVINLFGLAIRHNLTADDLKTTMFAYPTGASDIGDML